MGSSAHREPLRRLPKKVMRPRTQAGRLPFARHLLGIRHSTKRHAEKTRRRGDRPYAAGRASAPGGGGGRPPPLPRERPRERF